MSFKTKFHTANNFSGKTRLPFHFLTVKCQTTHLGAHWMIQSKSIIEKHIGFYLNISIYMNVDIARVLPYHIQHWSMQNSIFSLPFSDLHFCIWTEKSQSWMNMFTKCVTSNTWWIGLHSRAQCRQMAGDIAKKWSTLVSRPLSSFCSISAKAINRKKQPYSP